MDYRGEIKVILYNGTSSKYEIKKGDRIAQLVFAPIVKPEIVVFDDYKEWSEESVTLRGSGGLGSTGYN